MQSEDGEPTFAEHTLLATALCLALSIHHLIDAGDVNFVFFFQMREKGSEVK